MQRDASPVVSLRPSLSSLEERVRDLAKRGAVAVGSTASQSMLERDVSDLQVIRGMARGAVQGDVQPGGDGEWICDVRDSANRTRGLASVTVIIRKGRLLLVTLNWEESR
jgi:hypothetical protein